MTRTRMLITFSGLLLLLGVASACTKANASTSGIWVQVNPNNVAAGSKVMIRANCGNNRQTAVVASPAFESVNLQPANSALHGEAQVPAQTGPGTYEVTLTCASGGTANTKLVVTAAKPASPGPHTGGGFLATGTGTRPDAITMMWIGAGAGSLAAAGLVRAYTNRRRRADRH